MMKLERRPIQDQSNLFSNPPEIKCLDLLKQMTTREDEVVKYVKKVVETFKPYGGIMQYMSLDGIKTFMSKGMEYGGWVKHLGSEDIHILTDMVKQQKSLLPSLCPPDLQALASRQREHLDSVERGVKPGKDPFDTWIGHRAHNGQRIGLATASTPEKPILPGGGPPDVMQVVGFFRDHTAMSDHRRKQVMEALNNGKNIHNVLKGYERIQYQKEFGQVSAVSGEGLSQGHGESSSSRTERDISSEKTRPDQQRQVSESKYKPYKRDGSLEEMGGTHYFFTTRYKISPPDDNRSPYNSGYKDGCVVNTAMMLLRDQKINFSEDNVANTLFKPNVGYDDAQMPSLFESLKKRGAAPYTQISGDVTIATLRKALESGYAIGVGVRKENESPHMLVIDAIDPNYVYIRDSLHGGERYCVTIADFENALPYDAMVPSRATTSDSSNNSYRGGTRNWPSGYSNGFWGYR